MTNTIRTNGKMTPILDYNNKPIDHKRYGQLLAEVQPHPIKTELEYEEALNLVADLLHKSDRNSEEDILLDLMIILVSKYEDEVIAWNVESSPLERLKFLMEENGLKQADLVDIFGSSGTTSEVFNGKRSISKRVAVKLGDRFGLPASAFLV